MITNWFNSGENMIWLSIGIMILGALIAGLLFGIAKYQEDFMQGKINGSAGMKGSRIRIMERCRAGAIAVIFLIILPGFLMLLLAIS